MCINQIGVAFGAPWLDAALVVASGFYKLQGQKTRIGFLSIIARKSKRTTKAASSQGAPKSVAISCGRLLLGGDRSYPHMRGYDLSPHSGSFAG
jgi:hypothetical protein